MKMRFTVVYAGLRAVHAAAPGGMLIVHANAADTALTEAKAGWYSQLVDADRCRIRHPAQA